MKQEGAGLCLLAVLLAASPAMEARSTGPPVMRTGAAVDGGINCTRCHSGGAAANTGPGRVIIRARAYTPGVKQPVLVTVEDPDALRWGFQLIARHASDETRQAGTFAVAPLIRVRCSTTRTSPEGDDAPCEGNLEFASHTQPATAPSAVPVLSNTFAVEWTPPAANVGDVMFYAAGNAANNSGRPDAGDRTYTTSLRISPLSCNLAGAPLISASGVVNAATYRPGISLNSIISIYGSGFALPGTTRLTAAEDLVDEKVPKEFACLAVEIAGQRAPIFYVQPGQINAQAPTLVASGPVSAQVILNPGRANEIRSPLLSGVPMQFYAPALFTFNGRSVAARRLDGTIVSDPRVVAIGTPAKPGEVVVLYGTGFGVTEPVYQAGELPGAVRLSEQVTVMIGGTTIAASDVLYAGQAPGSAGLCQFNVRIPAAAPDGDLPVSFSIRGFQTPGEITIPVKR